MKDIVSKIKLSNWGLVFYNNALCLIVSAVVRGSLPTSAPAGGAPQRHDLTSNPGPR